MVDIAMWHTLSAPVAINCVQVLGKGHVRARAMSRQGCLHDIWPQEIKFEQNGNAACFAVCLVNIAIQRHPAALNRCILVRFFVTLVFLGAFAYAGMWGLATFVKPQPRDMSITIPVEAYAK